jgi:hypothetical protein
MLNNPNMTNINVFFAMVTLPSRLFIVSKSEYTVDLANDFPIKNNIDWTCKVKEVMTAQIYGCTTRVSMCGNSRTRCILHEETLTAKNVSPTPENVH